MDNMEIGKLAKPPGEDEIRRALQENAIRWSLESSALAAGGSHAESQHTPVEYQQANAILKRPDPSWPMTLPKFELHGHDQENNAISWPVKN